MSKLLLIAFKPSELIYCEGFAQALKKSYDILLLSGKANLASNAEIIFEANLSYLPPADILTESIIDLCKNYSYICAVSSMQSKDLMPRIAEYLRAGMVSDIISVNSINSFKRPILAGSLIATVETKCLPIVLTFRTQNFCTITKAGKPKIEQLFIEIREKTKKTNFTSRTGTRPDLSQAKVVISGGRPLKDSHTFEKYIGGLADLLGGAVGATRAAVDSGITPNELQIGQTGKVVAPDLYIAVGISGATQHVAGIKDSKTIVAINIDQNAPIFEIADFGILGDLFKIIPELEKKLRALQQNIQNSIQY